MVRLPPPLDSILPEIEPKAITNLSGAPGTGKTNLCLLAMLHCIQGGGTVTYIDTEGGFSFQRLAQLLPTYKLILRQINLLEPKNFSEQGALIRGLKGTDLVIVDSLSALYRLEFGEEEKRGAEGRGPASPGFHARDGPGAAEAGSHASDPGMPGPGGGPGSHAREVRPLAEREQSGHARGNGPLGQRGESSHAGPRLPGANRELSRQLSLLSLFAREQGVPVVITCHTFRSWDTGREEISGGEIVRYWSKGILFLEKTGRPGERKATLVKHRSLPEAATAKFLIDGSGIRPAGFRLF